MTGVVPTKTGDVLVLAKKGMSPHMVCEVSADGQQGDKFVYLYSISRDRAVAKARDLVVPDGRIFLKDRDSDEWEEISN